MQYWYSAQLRQYRLQFIRAFSNFSVKTGNGGPNNTPELMRVPCRYGDPTRIAASIVRGNSENKVLSVPFITCYVEGITMSPSRRQDPQLVVPVQVNERIYDPEKGLYTNEIGNRYTVERYMPVPYDLTMQVDIWTNNEDIKEQLLEQILVLYNPAIDIQTSVNPIDWTVLTIIEMMDAINWSSRSIPVGTDNPIDVATLKFKLPIWINPPAKVKKQSIIHEIVTNIVQGQKDPNSVEWNEYEFLARNITTPGDCVLRVDPISSGVCSLMLCDSSGSPIDRDLLPTVVSSSKTPSPFVGSSFKINGIICNISHQTLSDAINDIRASMSGSDLNCMIFNQTYMQFINSAGGDLSFEDIVPGTLDSLGISNATYPGGNLAWWRLLQLYGNPKYQDDYGSNASQIRLKTVDDIEQPNSDIVGWIDPDPIDQNKLIWTIDTQSLPYPTLDPIDAIVNPLTSGPGINLPLPAIGARYLLTEKPAEQSASWGTIDANENDIVEFNGSSWVVAWTPSSSVNIAQHVINGRTNRMYKWANGYWSPMIDDKYLPGYWRMSL